MLIRLEFSAKEGKYLGKNETHFFHVYQTEHLQRFICLKPLFAFDDIHFLPNYIYLRKGETQLLDFWQLLSVLFWF